MQKHSNTPWRIGGHPHDSSGTAWREILASGEFGIQYVASAVDCDAALIVRAVNAHADLVAAVESALSAYDEKAAQHLQAGAIEHETITAMRAALAKAKA